MLIKFGLVGVLNTVVDLAVFMLLTAIGAAYLPAQIVSYGCGVLNSYIFNKKWTFRSGGAKDAGEISRFLLVNLGSLAVASVLLEWLYGIAELPLFVSKLIATLAGVLINYAGSRYWVFRAHP